MYSYSSSSCLVSVSQWHAHSRVVVLHILPRGQIDTRLCTYLINCSNLYPLPLTQIWESSVLIPLLYYFRPYSSTSVATAAVSFAPSSSIPSFYHHRIPTHAPCFLSATSHRSKRDHTEIYCVTVFWLLRMYVSIVSNSTFTLSASAEFYYHLVSSLRRRSLPVSRRTTRSWKTPSTRPMQGVTTQVSTPKSNTNCTTSLKKNTDIRGLAPFLLRILFILLQTACAFVRFWISTGQSLSAANNTISRCMKYRTILRVHP